MGAFSNDIGIDIGSSCIRIYVKGKGLVIEEPSCALISRTGKKRKVKIHYIGREAQENAATRDMDQVLVNPIQFGMIKDNNVALQMLHTLVTFATGSTRILKPRFFISYPYDTNVNNKLVLRNMFEEIGARNVYLISKPFASAVGLGANVFEAKANMVIDSGSGTTDIAAISLGGVVTAKSSTFAGDLINNAIIESLGKMSALNASDLPYNIGFKEAEFLKKQLGSALPRLKDISLNVSNGKSTINVTSSQIYKEAITHFLAPLEMGIKSVFREIPLTMITDIVQNGIYLCGGTMLLPGIDAYIRKMTNVPVHTVQDPTRATINGLASIINNFDNIVQRGRISFLEVD